MKKNLITSIILAIMIAFAFVSCTKEFQNPNPVPVPNQNDTTHIVIPTPEDPVPTPEDPEWLIPNSNYSYSSELNYIVYNSLRIIESSPRYEYDDSNSIYAIVYEYIDTDNIVIQLKGRVESNELSADIVYLCYNDFDKLIEDFEKIKYVEENYDLEKYTIRLSSKVSLCQYTYHWDIYWNIIPIYQGISIDFDSYINYDHGGKKHLKIRYSDYIDLIEWLITLKNKL